MVECWEKEKSVAMAMAVLRIWHTRPESKKANVGVDAQLCQFEPGTALKRFFINQGFYLPVSFTSPQVYHEKLILEILLLSFPRGVFFSHLFNSLRWYRFFSKTSRWRCWWLPGTHHDRVTTLGAAALRPVTRACWEAGNSLVWWYRWLRVVKLMWKDLLYTVICNHNIYLYILYYYNKPKTDTKATQNCATTCQCQVLRWLLLWRNLCPLYGREISRCKVSFEVNAVLMSGWTQEVTSSPDGDFEVNGLAPWWSLPPSGLAMDATWLTWHSMIDGWWNPAGLESSETWYFVDGIERQRKP